MLFYLIYYFKIYVYCVLFLTWQHILLFVFFFLLKILFDDVIFFIFLALLSWVISLTCDLFPVFLKVDFLLDIWPALLFWRNLKSFDASRSTSCVPSVSALSFAVASISSRTEGPSAPSERLIRDISECDLITIAMVQVSMNSGRQEIVSWTTFFYYSAIRDCAWYTVVLRRRSFIPIDLSFGPRIN